MLQAPHRAKVFDYGNVTPLTRREKQDLVAKAHELARTKNALTNRSLVRGTALKVLRTLLWQFHNSHTGRCFPSYDAIASASGVARSDVGEAISALESLKLLSWCNRIQRIKRWVTCELLGTRILKTFVVRTSNGYQFFKQERQEKPAKTDNRAGTADQVFKKEKERITESCPNGLATSLGRYAELFAKSIKRHPP